MKEQIVSNWNFVRVLRLLMGAAIIIQGVVVKDGLFVLVGLLFSAMAVLNAGCCGAGSCTMPAKKDIEPTKAISYEEVAEK